jgi:hypothetical protein
MNHDTIKFQKRLDRFRLLTDKRRHVACEIMGISHSTYGRLRAALRAEANELTPMERFAINLANVRKFLGDRYPTSVMPAEIARAVGITPNQAARARDVLMRERVAVEREEAPGPPTPKRPKAERLFRVEGARLFSMNREPAEVGA